MSTRATIKFKDECDEYFVYCHCDGMPENVLKDINELIELVKSRWSGSAVGLLVACFLGKWVDLKQRIPDYELTTGFHGDESYKYYVEWKDKKWVVWCD